MPWRGAAAAGACVLALLLTGCTQHVQVLIQQAPGYGDHFTVGSEAAMDRRYWGRRFPSGSVVGLSKGQEYTLVIVDEQGAATFQQAVEKFPMRWYEALLTPLFGLGYALWQPFPNPYMLVPGGGADQRLRAAARAIAEQILTRVPPTVKVLGLFTFETDIVDQGRTLPYASEGNRRLTEYVYTHLRQTLTRSAQVRLFKYGVDHYLKHSHASLGEAVEARHELVGKLARDERLDMVVYGKNYLYPQAYTETSAIRRCRFSVDCLIPQADKTLTHDVFEYILAIGPGETELMRLFRPRRPGRVGPVGPAVGPAPSIEVALERAAKHLARDLLEKLGDESPVLATYGKPIATYVSDFGYVAAAPLDERVVLANRYGAYVASKVAQNLMVGGAGLFTFVSRKKVVDAVRNVRDRGKTIILRERSPWIDPMTWPRLGVLVGAKLVFRGRMERIGNDLNFTVWLQDLERGVQLAIVEHKIMLNAALGRQLDLGNLAPGRP